VNNNNIKMGMYYGLTNRTKRHNVSHYWKNNPPTIEELNHISKIFGWNLEEDVIETGSYCSFYKYDHDYEEWEEIVDLAEMIDNNADETDVIKVGYNPAHDASTEQDVNENIKKYEPLFDPIYYWN
jgi:hypothetical protein